MPDSRFDHCLIVPPSVPVKLWPTSRSSLLYLIYRPEWFTWIYFIHGNKTGFKIFQGTDKIRISLIWVQSYTIVTKFYISLIDLIAKMFKTDLNYETTSFLEFSPWKFETFNEILKKIPCIIIYKEISIEINFRLLPDSSPVLLKFIAI